MDAGEKPIAGRSGSSARAGTSSGGAAGASGAPTDPAPTKTTDESIHGRVLDGFQRPVPDATLRIGTQMAKSDAMGRFSFDTVPATYDLVLTVSPLPAAGLARHAVWRYEGLTRRDPTVQCFTRSAR